MANVDARFGFKPVKSMLGVPLSATIQPMYIASSYESDGMFVGDPVVKVSAGSNTSVITVPGGGRFVDGTLPQIQLAAVTDGTFVSGVIVGFAANPANLSLQYAADLTERVAFVCTDPYMIYEVQAEGTITDTMIGLNAAHINTHAGSTVTGMSGAEIDCGTTTAPAADASLMWRIIAQVNREDNDTNAANSNVLVVANMHSDLSTGDGDGALGI